MDDDFLRKTFHKYYQYGKDKDGNLLKEKNDRILSRDYAWLASKDIVQKWNHLDESQAEDFLNNNFEKAWRSADVNNDGKIKLNKAYTFEKSLMGSVRGQIQNWDNDAKDMIEKLNMQKKG